MSDSEVNRLVESLKYPSDMIDDSGDTQKERMKKHQLRTKFKQLYTTMVRSRTMDALLRTIGESMKQNFFVSLHGTQSYFQFDNPSSRKYIGRVHELGMISVDSDVFDHSKPVAPIVVGEQNYADYMLSKKRIYYGDTSKMYVSQTQYGYLQGVIPLSYSLNIQNILHLLPNLTHLSLSDDQNITYFTNKGRISFSDMVLVNQSTGIHFQKHAPPFVTEQTGGTTSDDILRTNPFVMDTMTSSLGQSLGQELRDYQFLYIVDNDFSAQKRDKHRVFKTAIKILKALRGLDGQS